MCEEFMVMNRRAFVQTTGMLTAAACVGRAAEAPRPSQRELEAILNAPVLTTDFLPEPVKIASIELLRSGKIFLLRTRSTDGVEAITVPHPGWTAVTWPILLRRVIPVFVGRDARELESMLWELYRHGDNYKLQGLALWVSVAAVEIGLLELMGRTARRPMADLFGGVVTADGRPKRDIAVYHASGRRGNRPEEEIAYLQSLVAESEARAIKFRLGGRMSRNADSLPGRSEALIPLVRKAFGDQMTLYADSNSSYDAEHAIRIGRMMEDNGYGFFEEPCPFDDLWATKEVADALKIPVAAGEQEFSLHRFAWTVRERGVDIVQPDLHYGGGFIRATKVARMAAAAGMQVVPHMSGGGLGYLDVVHFASFTPNAGPFMEFKGSTDVPVECDTSSLRCENGIVRCPTGAGFGVTIDAEFVRRAERLS
jgi:L-alanine-DL-glutamate epimerase-like enolase superfamily enzyme